MAKALFPSGPWVGFYKYHTSSQRFLMDLNLRFRGGRIEGDGADGINTFVIAGFYDERKLECGWQKIYPTHHVDYTGYREGKGIWGTWKIQNTSGGFQIWPLSEGGPPDLSKLAEEEEEELVITGAGAHWVVPSTAVDRRATGLLFFANANRGCVRHLAPRPEVAGYR